MLNSVNSYDLIFTWKLMSITMCIVSGFAAVAHFSEHPDFGVMYYVILFDVAFSYTIIYEKTFKIPELFDQAAACALLRIRGCRYDVFRRQWRPFHVLESKLVVFTKWNGHLRRFLWIMLWPTLLACWLPTVKKSLNKLASPCVYILAKAKIINGSVARIPILSLHVNGWSLLWVDLDVSHSSQEAINK